MLTANQGFPIKRREWIYVLGARKPVIGWQTIGIADDLRNRLSQYKTHSPVCLDLAFCQTCKKYEANCIETYAHELLQDKRIHGEWFNVTSYEAIEAVREAMRYYNQPEFFCETWAGHTYIRANPITYTHDNKIPSMEIHITEEYRAVQPRFFYKYKIYVDGIPGECECSFDDLSSAFNYAEEDISDFLKECE